MDSKQYMGMESDWGAPNYHPLPVVLAKGKGVWVWDVEGNKYMDFLSSYSAISQGHLHPHIVEAIRAQLDRLTLTSRAFYNDRLGPFMRKLCEVSGMEMGLPMNTGAEAVETAIKVARRWSYEQRGLARDKGEIVVCDHNFHGRTTTIVGFSSDAGSRDGFGPFTPGFVSVPFDDLEAFERAVGPNTIGILVEPIQAEAGIFVPKDGYLKGLRRICDEHGILLMLDEIQTGLARTGRMFAFEHEGVKPDVLCVGKALGGGVMPVSAALASKDIMSVMRPGSHGSTFGGNPLGCAIGEAAIDVIVEERLADRSMELGGYLMERLQAIKGPKVKQVRGRGLLVGVEMVLGPNETVRPHCERLVGMGMLCKDTHERTIRLAPPLVITKEELDWALERLAKVIS